MAEKYEQQPFQINPLQLFNGDLNTLHGEGKNGFYYCGPGCTNCPRTYSPLLVFGSSSGNYTTAQLLLGFNSQIYYRIYVKVENTWGTWKTVSFTQ